MQRNAEQKRSCSLTSENSRKSEQKKSLPDARVRLVIKDESQGSSCYSDCIKCTKMHTKKSRLPPVSGHRGSGRALSVELLQKVALKKEFAGYLQGYKGYILKGAERKPYTCRSRDTCRADRTENDTKKDAGAYPLSQESRDQKRIGLFRQIRHPKRSRGRWDGCPNACGGHRETR